MVLRKSQPVCKLEEASVLASHTLTWGSDPGNNYLERLFLILFLFSSLLQSLLTNDLFTYRVAVKHLQLGHQICQFHVRRWVGRAVQEFRETIPVEW